MRFSIFITVVDMSYLISITDETTLIDIKKFLMNNKKIIAEEIKYNENCLLNDRLPIIKYGIKNKEYLVVSKFYDVFTINIIGRFFNQNINITSLTTCNDIKRLLYENNLYVNENILFVTKSTVLCPNLTLESQKIKNNDCIIII